MLTLIVAATLAGDLDGFDRVLIERGVRAAAEATPGDVSVLRREVERAVPGGWGSLSEGDRQYAEGVVKAALRPAWHKVRANGYIFYVRGVKKVDGKISYDLNDQPASTKNVILYGDPAGPRPPPPVAEGPVSYAPPAPVCTTTT